MPRGGRSEQCVWTVKLTGDAAKTPTEPHRTRWPRRSRPVRRRCHGFQESPCVGKWGIPATTMIEWLRRRLWRCSSSISTNISATPQAWRDTFAAQLPDLEIRIWPDAGKLADIEYLAFMHPDFDALPAFPNLKAMFSRSAGVESFVDHPKLPKAPLGKVEPPGGDPMMTEYVVMHVLRFHRDMPGYQAAQANREWRRHDDRPARAKARRIPRLRHDGESAGAGVEVARLQGLGLGSHPAAGSGGSDLPRPRPARAVSQPDRYRRLPVAADAGNRGHLLRAHLCHDAERGDAGECRARQACGG